SSRLSTPLPMVALPCGSRSTSKTLRGVRASAAARLTAVVVLPTPPFWLATAMIRAMRLVPWSVGLRVYAGRRAAPVGHGIMPASAGACPNRAGRRTGDLAGVTAITTRTPGRRSRSVGVAADHDQVALSRQPGHLQRM